MEWDLFFPWKNKEVFRTIQKGSLLVPGVHYSIKQLKDWSMSQATLKKVS